jgi:hypothetical protein
MFSRGHHTAIFIVSTFMLLLLKDLLAELIMTCTLKDKLTTWLCLVEGYGSPVMPPHPLWLWLKKLLRDRVLKPTLLSCLHPPRWLWLNSDQRDLAPNRIRLTA